MFWFPRRSPDPAVPGLQLVGRTGRPEGRAGWQTEKSEESSTVAEIVVAELLRRRFWLVPVVLIVIAFVIPRIGQPDHYHQFADARWMLGVPNALNVLSNIPFAVVGLAGLLWVLPRRKPGPVFNEAWEWRAYAVFFVGVLATGFGSAWYHLAPENGRLVWDRLPIMVSLMGLMAAMLGERLGTLVGRRALVPLLVAGVGSVLFWYWSERAGVGDLRPYMLMQHGSLIVVLLLVLLFRPAYPGTRLLLVGLFTYAIATLLDVGDKLVYSLGQLISGHTLKHLVAAAAVTILFAMLRMRSRETAEA